MKRTDWTRKTRTWRYMLNCYDVIFAFHKDRVAEGIRKYNEILKLKPTVIYKAYQKAVENLTALLDGIVLFHSDKPEEAKALLLEAYEGVDTVGSKSLCSLYLSRIFSVQNRPDIAEKMKERSMAYASGTLFENEFRKPEISDLKYEINQYSVSNCSHLNTDDMADGHDQLKTDSYRKLEYMKKDSMHYLTLCTALALGFFIFTSIVFYITNFPEQNSRSNLLFLFSNSGIYTLIICGLFNGIWLFNKFIKNRSKATKIIFAVLSVVTLTLIYTLGVFLLVPTFIFYIFRLIISTAKIKMN